MIQDKKSNPEYVPSPKNIPRELTNRMQNVLVTAADMIHLKEDCPAVYAEEVAMRLGQDTLSVRDDLDMMSKKGYLIRHQIGSLAHYALLNPGKSQVAKIKDKSSKKQESN